MKLFPCMSCRLVLVAPVLFSTLSAIQAQGVERSIGSHEVAAAAAAPTRLLATLTPVEKRSAVRGGVTFGLADEGLDVSGRLDGLDPNKRYQLDVAIPELGSKDATNGRVSTKDGADNPGEVPPAVGEVNLGVLLADASGGFEIRTVLKGLSLAEGNRVILGKTLILTEIPAMGTSGDPIRVASATITVPEPRRSPVQPSRLDEIEPGERWF